MSPRRDPSKFEGEFAGQVVDKFNTGGVFLNPKLRSVYQLDGDTRIDVGDSGTDGVVYVAGTNGTGSGLTASITKPTGVQENDLLILFISSPLGSYSPWHGWTKFFTSDTNHQIYYRVAGDSEPSSYTVHAPATDSLSYQCVALRNAYLPSQEVLTANYDDTNFGATASWVAPNLSTPVDGGILLVGTHGNDAATVTTPTGFTLVGGQNPALGADTGHYTFYKTISGAEETGTTALTLSGAETGYAFSLMVNPRSDAIRVWDGEDEATTSFRVTNDGVAHVDTLAKDLTVNGFVWKQATAGWIAKNANQSLTSGNTDLITFSTADLDTMDMWNAATNGFRLHEPGLYRIQFKVRWNNSAAGDRRIFIYVDGTPTARNLMDVDASSQHEQEVTLYWTREDIQSIVYNEVTFYARQDTGGALSVLGDGTSWNTWIAYEYLGKVT